VQGGVAAAPVPYGYGYPYEYAYGGPAYYYGPPVFFSAGIGFVSRGGHAHGYRPGYYGGARTSGGLHVIPRQLRR